jgi:hypothetical protein
MTCFVLTDPQGQIKDRDMLDLYDGYLELCQPTKFFKEFEVVTNKELIGRNDVFCGHVNICKQIWKNLGLKIPELDCYPKELKEYFGRNIRKMDFLNCYNLMVENEENFGETYFIKPIKNKLFTGFTCTTAKEAIKVKDISPCTFNTMVYMCSYVKFDAEFRAYVFKNKIVDVFRYWGDNWSVTVDKAKVEHMVSLVPNPPVFYSLDFGIDDKGRTLLVEINDGYALGNYGLGPKQYAEMSMARWKEIMQ